MEVRARHIVEGFLSGLHRSPYFGQSVEFLQHREYVPGDDFRHVDWKVWAKQDKFFVKQYEEDTNLRCMMLVDVSNSMRYGAGPLNKYEYAATIAASLSFLLLKQADAVGCVAFDETVRMATPLRTKRTHLQSICRTLDISEPRDKTSLYGIMKHVVESYPRRGMVVLISDLLSGVDDIMRGLKLLRQRGHDVMIFHVMDDDELDFPFAGPTRFEGLEILQHLDCNPRALREAYLTEVNNHVDALRRGSAKNMCDYALIRTSDSLGAVLATYLSNRLGMHHKN